MMIDIFAHILPIKYDENLKKKGAPGFYQEEVITILPTLTDLDIRFRIMDKYEDYLQVLTIASPPVENVVGPKDAVELAKIANDEMAELVSKYPDRFISAIGCLPLNDMDASLKEIDRVINDLKFSGIQVFTDINGKPIDSPEFMPLYEKMQYYDLPIWLHPRRERIVPDYPTENSSKYAVYVMLGWPYETTVAMARLVFSGVFEKYPNLKIVTHHCGGMVPYFEQRIAAHRDFSINRVRRAQWPHLTKRPLDYFRMYYNDTAIWSTPALMCAYAFCGAEHMLFGTDMPYDSQIGHRSVRDTIRSIKEMGIPDSDKEKIFFNNARKLMRLTI
jgi:predicted TIM-barrel fold metal-dependent hydrolase